MEEQTHNNKIDESYRLLARIPPPKPMKQWAKKIWDDLVLKNEQCPQNKLKLERSKQLLFNTFLKSDFIKNERRKPNRKGNNAVIYFGNFAYEGEVYRSVLKVFKSGTNWHREVSIHLLLNELLGDTVPVIFGLGNGFIIMNEVIGKSLEESVLIGQTLNRVQFLKLVNFLRSLSLLGIHHADLHNGNIIVTSDESIQVIDFGLSKLGKEISYSLSDSHFIATSNFKIDDSSRDKITKHTVNGITNFEKLMDDLVEDEEEVDVSMFIHNSFGERKIYNQPIKKDSSFQTNMGNKRVCISIKYSESLWSMNYCLKSVSYPSRIKHINGNYRIVTLDILNSEPSFKNPHYSKEILLWYQVDMDVGFLLPIKKDPKYITVKSACDSMTDNRYRSIYVKTDIQEYAIDLAFPTENNFQFRKVKNQNLPSDRLYILFTTKISRNLVNKTIVEPFHQQYHYIQIREQLFNLFGLNRWITLLDIFKKKQ